MHFGWGNFPHSNSRRSWSFALQNYTCPTRWRLQRVDRWRHCHPTCFPWKRISRVHIYERHRNKREWRRPAKNNYEKSVKWHYATVEERTHTLVGHVETTRDLHNFLVWDVFKLFGVLIHRGPDANGVDLGLGMGCLHPQPKEVLGCRELSSGVRGIVKAENLFGSVFNCQKTSC